MSRISKESAGASFRGIDLVYIMLTVSALTGNTTKEGHSELDALLKGFKLVFGPGVVQNVYQNKLLWPSYDKMRVPLGVLRSVLSLSRSNWASPDSVSTRLQKPILMHAHRIVGCLWIMVVTRILYG